MACFRAFNGVAEESDVFEGFAAEPVAEGPPPVSWPLRPNGGLIPPLELVDCETTAEEVGKEVLIMVEPDADWPGVPLLLVPVPVPVLALGDAEAELLLCAPAVTASPIRC